MIIQRLVLLSLCALLMPGLVTAQDDTSEHQKAITDLITNYVDALNRGDAAAAAAHWSPTGEWINPQGVRVTGPADIEKELASMFAGEGGPKIELQDVEVRFISPNVATEEGDSIIIRPGDAPHRSTYFSILVKTDAGWKISSVRETKLPEPDSNQVHLRELEWMIGSWESKAENLSAEFDCDWTTNNNFLLRSFRAKIGEEVEHEGTQVIGWDPVRNQIRSWVFDSDGGFGQGFWTRNGDSWTIETSYQDWKGGTARSVNRVKFVDFSTFTFESVNRQLDEEALPDVPPTKLVRVTDDDKE